MQPAELTRVTGDYATNGFAVVDDFLPTEIAEEINDLWSSAEDWDQNNQVRAGHFLPGRICHTKSSLYPSGEEDYSAKFGRSDALETSARVNAIFDEHYKPSLLKVSGLELRTYDLRCYRLQQGDYYRTHIDDYAGDIGCIYYVNKKWVWDWGGILHFGDDDESGLITPVFPKFNRAVFVNHGRFRFPHFVSVVAEYAQAPRYTMISFNGTRSEKYEKYSR